MMSIPVVVAEVLDKEPSAGLIWLTHAPVAVLGYWLCRRRWWWLTVFLPLSLYTVWFGAVDLWDKFVGPAIFQESSSLYIQWHCAMALVLVTPLLGFFSALRDRRRQDIRGHLGVQKG